MDIVIQLPIVCLTLLTVGYAHPCGDNPLSVVDRYSTFKGLNSAELMVYLQENTPFDYHRLMSEYGRFLECTRAIQSGYYKRSIDNPFESSNPIETRGNVSDFADMGVDNKDHDGMSVEEYLRLFNLFNKTSKPAQQSTPETRPSMKEFDKILQRYYNIHQMRNTSALTNSKTTP